MTDSPRGSIIEGQKVRDATTICSKTKPKQMMLAFALSLQASTSATTVSTSDENSSKLEIWQYAALISSPSARPANVARLGPSVTAAFNVKIQRFAEPQVIRIDACGLQRADVQKYIRTARVVLDETEAAVGLPHFQASCSHRSISPSPSAQRISGSAE
jgi:hypothetical protein